jgi:hypothetical protein
MRWQPWCLIGAGLPLCWLLMMVVHEAGHVLGACGTGGVVEHVVLHPLKISRTDLARNPAPAVVAWSGPLLGSALPLGLYWLARRLRWQVTFLLRFFAGFCLIANGVYIGAGSLDGVGDADDMLRAGSPMGCLWLFAVISSVSGLILWHRLGPQFGLGPHAAPLKSRWACLICGLLLLVVVVELLLAKQ